MESLKRYEGLRGVIYFLGILGLFAPTYLALFLFQTRLFMTMEWTKLFVLSAAFGGVVCSACLAGGLIAIALERALGLEDRSLPLSKPKVVEIFSLALIASLFCQMFAFFGAWFTTKGWAYYFASLPWVCLGSFSANVVPVLIRSVYGWAKIKFRKRQQETRPNTAP